MKTGRFETTCRFNSDRMEAYAPRFKEMLLRRANFLAEVSQDPRNKQITLRTMTSAPNSLGGMAEYTVEAQVVLLDWREAEVGEWVSHSTDPDTNTGERIFEKGYIGYQRVK